MIRALKLELEIRLTGLRSAAHYKGREGVIRDKNPTCLERGRGYRDDATCLSVSSC